MFYVDNFFQIPFAAFFRHDTMTVFVEWATQFCDYNVALKPTKQMIVDAERKTHVIVVSSAAAIAKR